MEYTIRQVNRTMAMLQIIAANAAVLPGGFSVIWNGAEFWFWGFEERNVKKEMAAAIRALRRSTNGKVTKEYTESYFTTTITHTLPDEQEIKFVLRASRRQICTLVETGETQMVEEIDYKNAPRIMVEKPVTEWICDSILEGA